MKNWRSIIALILVGLLIVGMFATIATSLYAYGDEVSDMRDELESIAEKKQRLEKELAALENKTNVALEEKSIIDQQIFELNKESNLLNKTIDGLKTKLAASRANLAEAESQLDENIALAKERIRAMYELGDTSYLSLVLGADSIEDFTTRYQVVKQMSEYDQSVIEQLKETKATIENETLAIETMTNEQEDALEALEGNVSNLRQKQAQSQALINRFNEQSEENLKAIEAAEAAEEALQAEIREAMANSTNDMEFDGKFLWPVDGYYTITDVFGMRTHPITGVYKLHTGVDISGGGINGKPIRASGDGIVLKSGYNTAYGNYVVIDHGDGYSTLYAHARSLCVSAGQAVVKGDTIAFVGSTGYSTGAHLHFEVIQNGTQLNPLSFFEGYNLKFV